MPLILFAGMPRVSAVLTEAAHLRLEVISFFLLVLLLSAAAIRWLWNGLTRDFPRLPHMSYWRALGVIVLWGAAFVLVLAMISGARELMTPGAWKPNGVTYKLDGADKPEPVLPVGPSEDERRRKLDDLRVMLWSYASAKAGALPSADDSFIPDDKWRTPHASGMRYLYVPGRKLDPASRLVVAYEPDIFGGPRFVLTAGGDVRSVTTETLQELLRN